MYNTENNHVKFQWFMKEPLLWPVLVFNELHIRNKFNF